MVKKAVLASVAFGLFVVAACTMPSQAGVETSIPDASIAPLGATSCPCEVGDSTLLYVLACDTTQCVTIGGQKKGYHCGADGQHEDDSFCVDAGCVPKTCTELGSTCGTTPAGCGRTHDCGICGEGTFCSSFFDFEGQRSAYSCFPTAQNLVIFASPAGGLFTIDVDENIPQLAIGLSSTDVMDVTIGGAYISNVSFVYYVGNAVAAINGIANSIVSQVDVPPGEATAYLTSPINANLVSERCQDEAFTGTIKVSDHGTCP